MLLFRLAGLFLLRFAVREFLGLLFQDPPRRTGSVYGGRPTTSSKTRAAQQA
jgi:hypothetical protein